MAGLVGHLGVAAILGSILVPLEAILLGTSGLLPPPPLCPVGLGFVVLAPFFVFLAAFFLFPILYFHFV